MPRVLICTDILESLIWPEKKDTEKMEQVDEIWMDNLFECSRNIANDILYLKLGMGQISYLITVRKQLYLLNILQQN